MKHIALAEENLSSSLNQKNSVIYIYHDEGASKESLIQTLAALKSLEEKYKLETIDAQQLKQRFWTQDALLFVMPGGADLPYVKKLNGKGNTIIKEYVAKGGSFLGICAGSYFGSSYVEFDKGGPLEVVGHRELSFFEGKAIGPVLAPYDYKTKSGVRAAVIQTVFPDVPEVSLFYSGGGFFENAQHYPYTKVVGIYENQLPAIVFINYGKGKVLLSGVHFEYDPFLLDTQDLYIQKVIEPLHKSNAVRKILFERLMQLLKIQ